MEAIQTLASEVLVNIALAVISLLAAYAMYGLHKLTAKAQAQIEQIEDSTARQKLEDALADVENLATVTVGAIEQTTAKALREAVKAGQADKEQLEALAQQAKEEIAAAVTPEAQRVISDNLGSFDEYVAKLIEERILELKTATGQG